MEKPRPAPSTGLLNRRNTGVLSPIVVCGGQKNGGMFESGRKKGPYEDLFIADEHGGVLIMDVYCSASKEIQWHAFITKRLPHCDRNGNAILIESGIILSACEQHIQVAVLLKKISRIAGLVYASPDKDGAVLLCDRG